MRKYFILFLLLISLIVFASCSLGGNDDFDNSSTGQIGAAVDNVNDNQDKYIIVCPNYLQELGVHRIISESIKNSNGENIETIDESVSFAGGGISL